MINSQKQITKKDNPDLDLPLRITLLSPTPGARFCLQAGRSDLIDQILSTGNDLSFDFSVRVRRLGATDPPRFLGPFTQGPADARFVYVNSGTMAGQKDTCWTRRAKIPLRKITWKLIEECLRAPGSRLEARIRGTARDGGPACATVPLLGPWSLVN